jgi:hypothetical protein
MSTSLRRHLALWIMGWGTLLVLAACDIPRSTPPPTVTPSQTPVVLPTATETPAATLIPLILAPISPVPRQHCENDAPLTQLILAERGRVLADDPRPINVRSGPGTNYRILGRIEIDQLFLVLDGPECSEQYAWYRVRYADLEGWLAEGDSTNYYVEPHLPG